MIFNVVKQAVEWLDAGYVTYWVTVVETSRSAPSPAGSVLAIRADGLLCGNISSGCIEQDLIKKITTGPMKGIQIVNYDASQYEELVAFLPCGGQMLLAIEVLTVSDSLLPVLQSMSNQQLIMRQLCLKTGQVVFNQVPWTETEVEPFYYDNVQVKQLFGPYWQLLIIGAV